MEHALDQLGASVRLFLILTGLQLVGPPLVVLAGRWWLQRVNSSALGAAVGIVLGLLNGVLCDGCHSSVIVLPSGQQDNARRTVHLESGYHRTLSCVGFFSSSQALCSGRAPKAPHRHAKSARVSRGKLRRSY